MSHPDHCLHEQIKTINAYKCECVSCGEVFERDGDLDND